MSKDQDSNIFNIQLTSQRSWRRLSWLVLVAILVLSKFLPAQTYPYALVNLEYKADPLIQQIFKDSDLKFDAEAAQTMLQYLDSLLGLPNITNHQKAICLTVSGYLLVEQKEREEAFLLYKEALPLVENLPKDDLVYSVVHGNYGMYMSYYQVHDIALPHLKKALPALTAINKGGSFKERGLYEAVINSYYATGQIDSAMVYQDIMIEGAKRQGHELLVSQMYNNAGWFSHHRGRRYDKAIQYYNSAVKWADTTTEMGLFYYVNAFESRAHSFVQLGSVEQAIADLKYTYLVRRRLGRPRHSMQALAYLLNYYMEAGQVKEAYKFVQSELSYFDLKATLTRRGAPAYLALAKVYQRMGDTIAAQPYLNTYNQYLADEYRNSDLSKSSYNLNAYMTYRNQVHEQGLKLERLEKEKLSQKLISTRLLLFFLGSIFLLLVSLVYAIGKWRVSQREQKLALEQKSNETLQLKNQNLQYELRLKEQDIRRIAADNKIRTNLKRKFLQQLKKLSRFKDTELKKELRFLIREIEETIDNQEQLSLLQQKVETINASFEERIREKIKGVSAQEIKLCSLIKIGMSNQEIAKLLYKQDSTIRSYKYRLKKKAGLDSVKELERMVMEL